MTANVVRLHELPSEDAREALVAAVHELHALISIDPVLGASPARTYFVLNPQAQARIAACVGRGERPGAFAYALVAYDFPLALFQFQMAASAIPEPRAKAIIEQSAALQGGQLVAAARALGLKAHPVAAFDAAALKAVFFPQTQETVVHLLRVALEGA